MSALRPLRRRDRDLVEDPIRFVDSRLGAAPLIKKALNYVFPDHWSFLLGEIALYSFVVLLVTGTYLALFFVPSTSETVYNGAYGPLQGLDASEAYVSAVRMTRTGADLSNARLTEVSTQTGSPSWVSCRTVT